MTTLETTVRGRSRPGDPVVGLPPRPVAHASRAVASPLDLLTCREREVLERLARGRSNAELARDLHLGEATVKTHVSNVLAKLGLRDRTAAVVFAYEHGVVVPGLPSPC